MAHLQRLLVATPLYPPDPGGPATYSRLLEREFPEQGIQVVIVKFGDVRHLPKLVRHVAYFFLLLKAGRSVDAILALDPVSVGLPASVAAKFLGKHFFVKVVGDYAWEQGRQRFGITVDLDTFVHTSKVPFLVTCLRKIQIYVVKGATRVIVPSHYLQTILEAWGIPESRIRMVYNAVEEGALGVCPQKIADTAKPVVLYIGRLVPWKHVDGIIDAVAELSRRGTPALLVVVGTGPLASYLETKALEVGAECIFLGEQNPPNTQALLVRADVLVLNSSYEGLSHVLIEGLVRGKAIIATRAGGNTELITHQQNGLLIPVGDTEALVMALSNILKDATLRTRLEHGATASRSKFSVDSMISRTIVALT